MNTELTKQEMLLFNGIKDNDINNKDSYLKVIYRSEILNKKDLNSLLEKINEKKEFFNNSILLYNCKGFYVFGKIGKYFWFMDEYEQIYLVSTNIIDIPITITRLTSYWDLEVDLDLSEFWNDRQFQYDGKCEVKSIYDSFFVFCKQYGYEFDLMKDIDNYKGIEEDIVEFNKLLALYGILNKKK